MHARILGLLARGATRFDTWRFARGALTLAVFGLGSVVNPVYMMGCAADNAAEQEEDTRAKRVEQRLLTELDALNEARSFVFTASDGKRYEVRLDLSQSKASPGAAAPRNGQGFTSRAYACGTYTFFEGASACDTAYELAIEGTLSLFEVDSEEPLVADYALEGRLSDYGEASLHSPEDPATLVALSRDADGFEVRLFAGAKLGAGAAHVRLAP